jgi:hypothetical protein
MLLPYQDSFQELVSLGDHVVTETTEGEILVRLQGMVIIRLKVVSFRIMQVITSSSYNQWIHALQ